jgi:hypothetical protein
MSYLPECVTIRGRPFLTLTTCTGPAAVCGKRRSSWGCRSHVRKLLDSKVAPRIKGGDLLRLASPHREHDHRHRRSAAQTNERRLAVVVRQAEIEDHEVRPFERRRLQGPPRRLHLHLLIAMRLWDDPQKPPYRRLVRHHQDPRRRLADAPGSSDGSSISIFVARLSASTGGARMSPPCASHSVGPADPVSRIVVQSAGRAVYASVWRQITPPILPPHPPVAMTAMSAPLPLLVCRSLRRMARLRWFAPSRDGRFQCRTRHCPDGIAATWAVKSTLMNDRFQDVAAPQRRVGRMAEVGRSLAVMCRCWCRSRNPAGYGRFSLDVRPKGFRGGWK